MVNDDMNGPGQPQDHIYWRFQTLLLLYQQFQNLRHLVVVVTDPQDFGTSKFVYSWSVSRECIYVIGTCNLTDVLRWKNLYSCTLHQSCGRRAQSGWSTKRCLRPPNCT